MEYAGNPPHNFRRTSRVEDFSLELLVCYSEFLFDEGNLIEDFFHVAAVPRISRRNELATDGCLLDSVALVGCQSARGQKKW